MILHFSCSKRTDNQGEVSKLLEHEISPKLLDAPSNFHRKPGEYLEWQAENLLDMVEDALEKFPPQVSESIVRHMAMLMLDAVLHDVDAPNRPAVQNFHHSRTLRALKEMESVKVNRGAMIWKLYNSGIVVRTKTLTVAFDLVSGYSSRSENFALPDSIIQAIVSQCDVFFISHMHRDHADERVAQTFLNQGKPVVAPPEIWMDLPIYRNITHLEREAHKVHSVPVRSRDIELKVVVYPGRQGQILNNVTLVITPEGISFCHTGDQWQQEGSQAFIEDFTWIDKVGEHFTVDILFPNTWTTDPQRVSKGFAPKLIIPVHENELGHSIDHREAYALNYSRWNVPFPKLLMSWGESYHYNF
jgi:L-ascorbate metabolism protein UlaG (beta-lactamase superfamily)